MSKLILLALSSLFSFSAFAADLNPCNPLMEIKCNVSYLTYHGAVVQQQITFDNFKDENWDEPSLANCAATAYTHSDMNPATTIRINASKDLNSNKVEVSAGAVQLQDKLQDGQIVRYPYYSDIDNATAYVDSSFNFNNLQLSLPATLNDKTVTQVQINCQIK